MRPKKMREVRAMYQVRPSRTNRRDKDAEGWVDVVLKGWWLGELVRGYPMRATTARMGHPVLLLGFDQVKPKLLRFGA
jgi:hypothetical protein